MSLCLIVTLHIPNCIVTLHIPNCGMLELLYAHNLTLLLMYLFNFAMEVFGYIVLKHIDGHHCLSLIL